MNSENYHTYYLPALQRLFGVNTRTVFDDFAPICDKFDALIGYPGMFRRYINPLHWEDPPMPAELIQLLTCFSGPYGETMWKTYLIQRSENVSANTGVQSDN